MYTRIAQMINKDMFVLTKRVPISHRKPRGRGRRQRLLLRRRGRRRSRRHRQQVRKSQTSDIIDKNYHNSGLRDRVF